MTTTVTTCDHAERFVTLDGRTLCESCARIGQGWTECVGWGCPTLTPPDRRYCDTHAPGGTEPQQCADCKGDGIVDCEDFDCHGEFCDMGDAECQTCGGTGEVEPADRGTP